MMATTSFYFWSEKSSFGWSWFILFLSHGSDKKVSVAQCLASWGLCSANSNGYTWAMTQPTYTLDCIVHHHSLIELEAIAAH